MSEPTTPPYPDNRPHWGNTTPRRLARARQFFDLEGEVYDEIAAYDMAPDDYTAFCDRADNARTISELRAIVADIRRGCRDCLARGYYVPATRYYGQQQRGGAFVVFRGYLCDQCAESEDYKGLNHE